jgi:ATP-dependent DNA ligase
VGQGSTPIHTLWHVVARRPTKEAARHHRPCIPTRVSKPQVGPQWIYEIKHDGYRLIARKQDGRVRLFTRRGYDWTDRYPLIVKAVAALLATSATVGSVNKPGMRGD